MDEFVMVFDQVLNLITITVFIVLFGFIISKAILLKLSRLKFWAFLLGDLAIIMTFFYRIFFIEYASLTLIYFSFVFFVFIFWIWIIYLLRKECNLVVGGFILSFGFLTLILLSFLNWFEVSWNIGYFLLILSRVGFVVLYYVFIVDFFIRLSIKRGVKLKIKWIFCDKLKVKFWNYYLWVKYLNK